LRYYGQGEKEIFALKVRGFWPFKIKFIKKLILSFFGKIQLKEECITSKTWITDTNLHRLMKISL